MTGWSSNNNNINKIDNDDNHQSPSIILKSGASSGHCIIYHTDLKKWVTHPFSLIMQSVKMFSTFL